MMRRALFHAARGLGRTTPNPMVGAVVVSTEGVVVGQGFHERAGTPHAEVHALDAAGEQARGATLYVTLEPCCHTGRTGPCTRRILASGVARVVAAMEDPDPRVSGGGFAELRAQGVVVEAGLLHDEARRLNESFCMVRERGRPFVVIKAATSLDARVARAPGVRTVISSPAANRKTHGLRATVDAVAVGSETARVDDPVLTVRECQRLRPLARVVFDRRLRTSPTARLLSTLAHGPVIIVTSSRRAAGEGRAAALEAAGATVLEADSLAEALRGLLAWEVSTLLVEGGPQLQAALWQAGLVDRLHLVIAPHVIGAGGVQWLDAATVTRGSWSRVSAEPRGPDIWIEADVHRNS
ncbi:MAG TPA: bifunctional diaminohydroxyphosphoribosylaminopyrimidine deaminase/5-amino-6-(5-phosphoribosylamino)uracil reductase RibD [Vicinamibacterales bacterium]|nr:bifunctional diaminohydroxyphosphoribosylaminopyrimidine deaminase/5-amino-6-(5-phosphoribosylamino)uracil reductase RibD [Vicinamibacterales bacterium]